MILSTSTVQFFNIPIFNKVITITFLLALSWVVLNKDNLRVKKCIKYELALSFIFLLYNLLSFIWSGYDIITFLVSIQFPITLFFIALSSSYYPVMVNGNIEGFVSKVAITLFSSWLVFSIFGFFILGQSIWFNDLGINRLSGSLGVSASSILNTLVYVLSFYLAYLKKIRIYYILVFFSIVCVFLAGTRISLFSCVISSLVIIFLSENRYKYLYAISILPVVLYLIWEKILSRLFFDGSLVYSIDSINFNGRRFIWDIVFENIDNYYFGMGAGSSISLLQNKAVGVGIQPHNDYIRILHDLGLLGLCMFSFILLFITFRCILNVFRGDELKDEFVLVISLLTCFYIVMFTDNAYIYSFFFIPILLIYFSSVNLLNRK